MQTGTVYGRKPTLPKAPRPRQPQRRGLQAKHGEQPNSKVGLKFRAGATTPNAKFGSGFPIRCPLGCQQVKWRTTKPEIPKVTPHMRQARIYCGDCTKTFYVGRATCATCKRTLDLCACILRANGVVVTSPTSLTKWLAPLQAAPPGEASAAPSVPTEQGDMMEETSETQSGLSAAPTPTLDRDMTVHTVEPTHGMLNIPTTTPSVTVPVQQSGYTGKSTVQDHRSKANDAHGADQRPAPVPSSSLTEEHPSCVRTNTASTHRAATI